MAKILLFAIFCCVAVAMAQPFIPQPSDNYAAEVTIGTSINWGIPINGFMWVDASRKSMRFDASVADTKMMEIATNNTLHLVTISGNQNPTCETDWQLMVTYSTWWWAPFAQYVGRDWYFGCELFDFGITGTFLVTGCFSSPTTPVYLNTTTPIMIGSQNVQTNIFYKSFTPGSQSPSIFVVPPICPPPMSRLAEKSQNSINLSKLPSRHISPSEAKAFVQEVVKSLTSLPVKSL